MDKASSLLRRERVGHPSLPCKEDSFIPDPRRFELIVRNSVEANFVG